MDKAVLQLVEIGLCGKRRHLPDTQGSSARWEISPTISNMVLDGLGSRPQCSPPKAPYQFVRYADDFIITGKSKKILKEVIQPVVEAFLAVRGLELSVEKTLVTHIKNGFTFLGQTFRKLGRKLHKSDAGIHTLMQKVKELIANTS